MAEENSVDQNIGVDESITAVYKTYIQSLNTQIQTLQNTQSTLEGQAKQLQVRVEGLKDSLALMNTRIAQLEASTKSLPNTVWGVMSTPYGAGIVIVFIIALVLIALKKGFSISKGNTKISVGEDK
ncbi:hypothetical protein [Fibrobacter sp. UWEL]|uniref:hypothetical protein n=1 Tax=Fibrobacter sp. UWEL TaxID=1896209 RepID=UPI000910A07D|nr:hypothetical protein [Fibrobacter sp. UWEL]SHK55188.1 hypothetical protein SAMN05720468_10390 [Fibrobacter sp. UWEL]